MSKFREDFDESSSSSDLSSNSSPSPSPKHQPRLSRSFDDPSPFSNPSGIHRSGPIADDSLYEEPDDLLPDINPFKATTPPPVRTPSTLPGPAPESNWHFDPQPPRPPTSDTPPPPPHQPTSTPITHPHHLKTLFVLTLATTLLPAHAYLIWTASLLTVVEAWGFAFVVTLYFVASCILVLGILVPPFMLVHWVWEVWSESDGEGSGEGEGEVGVRRDGGNGEAG